MVVAEAELNATRGDDMSETSSVSENETRRRTEQFVIDQSERLSHRPLTEDRYNAQNDQFRRARSVSPVIPQSSPSTNQGVMDIITYLTKQGFMPQRIERFNEQCESYLSWKLTFHDVMRQIKATPSEELELLTHYLGRNSKLEVSSIKASNAGNSERGLRKAWERLDETYGSPEKVEHALKRKLLNIVKVPITYKSRSRLYDLSDTLNEIKSVKLLDRYGPVFSYMDTSSGIQPVVNKLPVGIRNKWRDRGLAYKKRNDVIFPPFSFFCSFIQEMAAAMNDPGFDFTYVDNTDESTGRNRSAGNRVSVTKTVVEEPEKSSETRTPTRCLIHNATHSLEECKTFISLPIDGKKEILRKHGHCYRCIDGKHLSKNCRITVKCAKCGSKWHRTIMHVDFSRPSVPVGDNGGENVVTICTEICGRFKGKSCAKIVLVNIHHRESDERPVQVYAILDEQSTHSLAGTDLFDLFNPDAPYENYPLETCSGQIMAEGRISSGFVITSLDSQITIDLPEIIECDKIPSNRQEIPTPEVAAGFLHLKDIAQFIPPLNPCAAVSLLIGRDLLSVHHIMDQRIGLPREPFAQKVNLGWVIIGESCLGGHSKRPKASVMKTCLQSGSNPLHNSIVLDRCEYNIQVTKDDGVFMRTSEDNKVSMSVEDKEFLSIMDKEMVKEEDGHWMAPLPFRKDRQRLPNNRSQALDRAQSLTTSLKRNPVKHGHFVTFMKGLFDAGHAEQAPPLQPEDECWYLPLFGVYHPQKKDRIRGVFDSSATFNGVSLNKVLLTGPDLMNSLLGVLMRFRREKIAVMADIEQMFYCFRVHEDHRRFLRFIWHQDNDVTKPLIDFQMKVHVFGNSPSPAVATYGLRRTAKDAEKGFGSDIKTFVERNFYVDDALSCHSSPEEAIDLLRRTQTALQVHGGLRLHKIISNSEVVLSAFNTDDLAKDVRNIAFGRDDLPTQRSLGMCWDLEGDHFTYKVSMEDKPFTRRGVLSSINSLFDPLGFVAPVTIAGKAILREAMNSGFEWDEPLPPEFHERWDRWKNSLKHLEDLHIPRTYSELSFSQSGKELFIFSDASQMAISAVAYVRFTGSDGKQSLGFLTGKAKLAPKHGHTVPRLELCAAVLATELYHTIRSESDIDFQAVRFFTDSRVVLGYIRNQTKRFFTYVANRVERIRSCSTPQDWNYVPSKLNPADEGTRSVAAADMKSSLWLNGPSNQICDEVDDTDEFPLIEPDSEVRTLKTNIKETLEGAQHLESARFSHFSSWNRLIRAVSWLKCCVSVRTSGKGTLDSKAPESLKLAEEYVIRSVQIEAFSSEIAALKEGRTVSKDSSVRTLDPYLDENGLLRVGGRLRHSNLSSLEKNPLLLPKKHHVSCLLVRHFHELVSHQGRLITEGAIRSAGFWVVGSRRMILSLIGKCVRCQKLRGKQQSPKMADLPEERLVPAPPFAHIGIDVFGPWNVVARKTRGGQAQHKRWAVIFTCLVVRAIHIEVIHEMSSSSFINALRRLIALRGDVKLIRSDCGTNFVGAAKELNANVVNVDGTEMKDHLSRKGITWKFNPPHASHMGGVWERLIGVSRRILDSLLCDIKHLTDEVLVTLMAEVCQIVNARPVAGVPSDPYAPMPLSPSMILTLKSHHSVDFFTLDDFSHKDLYRKQWRCVQELSNRFWKRWRSEYLSQLQHRRKWQEDQRNLREGDVVLLRDKTAHRSEWPLGIVEHAYQSDDSRVRKVDIRIPGQDQKVLSRPATEVVLLVPQE